METADTKIREAFAEAYRYRLRNLEPHRAADGWEKAASDIGVTASAHAGNELLKLLLMACYEDMERRAV